MINLRIGRSQILPRAYLFGVITTGILLIYLFKLSSFQINDDILISGISDGTLYDSLSSNVVYPSILIGNILVLFYDLNAEINWYFALLFSTQVGTLLFFIYFVSKKLKLKLDYFIIYLLSIIVTGIFLSLQYTQTAIFLAGIATFTFLLSEIKIERYFTFALLLLGILWRFEAGILGAGVAFAVYIIFNNQKIFTLRVFTYALALLGAIGIHLISLYALYLNKSPENSEFYRFNSTRQSVQGFGPIAEIDAHLYSVAKEIGWSKNDYALSQRKSYASDQEVYSTAAYGYISDNRYPEKSIRFVFNFVRYYLTSLLSGYLYLVGVVFFLPLLIYWLKDSIWLSQLILFWVALGSVLSAVLYMGKMPERIVWPLVIVGLFAFIAMAFGAPGELETNRIKNSGWGIFLLVSSLFFVTLILTSYASIARENLWWNSAIEKREQGFDRVARFESDKPIVAFSSFYSPLFKTAAPHLGPNQLPQIRKDLIVVGWVNRSPDYEANLERLGLSQDLFTSIAEGDAYLAVGNIEDLQMVNQFLREHRNIEVKWPQAPFVFNDTGLGIWKVESFSYIN